MEKNPKRWLYHHTRFLFYPLLLLIVINIVMSLAAIFFAFYSKETIDYALEGDRQRFIMSAMVIALLMMIQLLSLAFNQYTRVYYKGLTDLKLKQLLFGTLLGKKADKIAEKHSGIYVNHLTSDVDFVSDGLVEIIPRFVFYMIRFFGAFVLLFILDSLFALVFLGLGVVLLVMSRLISKEMKRRHHLVQNAQANERSFIQESVENIPVIKTFEAERAMQHKLERYQKPYFKAKRYKNQLNMLAFSGMNVFFAFGLAFAIIFGAWRLQAGVITVGSLMAIVQLVNQIQSPFSGLSTLIPRAHELLAATERLMSVDLMEDEVQSKIIDKGQFKILHINDVCFSYGDKQVLNNVSVSVPQGDVVHLQGVSGQGKTTLFKLLLGLLETDQGTIEIELEDQTYPINAATRHFFSYVPQGHMMLSGTIKENLELYQEADSDRLEEVCRIACIHDDIMNLPFGYETLIGEKGYGLSEGQIQRLAIARALIKDAPILLLDEITSALDSTTEKTLLINLKQLTNKTCIIVSHKPLASHIVDQLVDLSR